MYELGEVVEDFDEFGDVLFALRGSYAANWVVAMKRVEKLKAKYEEHGFAVWVNKHFNSGVDMMVFEDSGRVVEVCEVTNYAKPAPAEYVSKEKFERYVEDLNWFDRFPDVRKVMYVSFESNLTDEQRRTLKENSIQLVIAGGQD